tara:strand:+ start:4324 stop:4929 length:606 start_codon:yes stop_codon:yes gene_type:complete
MHSDNLVTGSVVIPLKASEGSLSERRIFNSPCESYEVVLHLIEDAQAVLYSDSETAIACLTQAIDLLCHAGVTSSTIARRRGGLARWQIKRVDSFIDSHIDSAIHTPQLAAILNLSVSHFTHAFKDTMGIAPLTYVTKRRLVLAREAMLGHEKSLTDIALSHGFCDQSHFSRMFRRETGLTPKMWQRVFGKCKERAALGND